MTDEGRLIAGRYQVGPRLGRGGMSEVYLGTDTRLGRTVAIKELKLSLSSDSAFRLRFRQEAQSASRMSHPTIVRVFDAGEEVSLDDNGAESRRPFIVMEHIEGRLLKDLIAEGPLDVDEAVRITEGILTALEYSHRAGVVHRDIKPGNIMLTPSGQVKVMDFGIARAVSDSAATVAQTTAILGTAAYFSPEQAKGEQVDARSDLYSAGIVLFELLTGRAPFRGDTPVAVAYQHVSETPPAPSSINPAVTPALDAVVARALSKDRYERFQGAAEFRDDLRDAAAGRLPDHRPIDELTTSLFAARSQGGVNDSELALRQLAEDNSIVRTQRRPPVLWIWSSIVVLAVIVAALVIWVLTLQPASTLPSQSREVPTLTETTYDSAQSTLTELDLVPSQVAEYSSTVPEGEVIRTDPGSGTIVAPETVIRIVVSQGPQPVAVPDTVGQSLAEAIDALTAVGFVEGSQTRENSPTVPGDVVLSASPGAGQQVAPGTPVDLTVSSGQVTLPDLVGTSLSSALATLASEKLQLVGVEVPDETCDATRANPPITTQSLAPGDVPQGSTVQLGYCAG
ncbi:Stk1 family PASTA domain-containing Ser/Thr kinase [Rathayibacter sp. AY1G1]|uniref:Stk1 family PASTA domain-containing Ser/Thr kinase n=1 Tax=unclassified Rathayibacter TaxID=2609250 RepID=UPI000CE85B37|nr:MULTISPECIES: Stk1 family PASTA domain-containing Ser/Thr kinase [unclassified Rathayibacter]PPF10546.1 Stk1 family PASTA domain-containing Ser/Thr kinase [Rathayibacter sp. AY1A5]PPF26410.1 Stk1 family PASTA domain-containing Ser/Thr kinase [Rathayibacter sp. AY1F2]PPF49841.1 Stk1 family PASTA domain-containing Ser/Thr kinase [Rathayibacter sp. AY1A1]PPF58846.1 Stk1 family PASTA domain-containing Ser/Thr kinase [Rathayibacter sp. AY1C2]PPG16891.1 Stk1 family PASTA domain-containing Ser/Thr